MNIQLTENEARVIGCLMEKEVTTPDNYPLSLNALTNACNQKSSRDPVMSLDEHTVQNTLDTLAKRHLVSDRSGFSGRVTKYKHRFCNSEFGSFQVSEQEFGLICVLLLRGAQSSGELRTRTNRMCKFEDNQDVENVLNGLVNWEDEPLAVKLPKQLGQRDARYMHLFCGPVDIESLPQQMEIKTTSSTANRLDNLEDVVAQLRQEIDQIKELLD